MIVVNLNQILLTPHNLFLGHLYYTNLSNYSYNLFNLHLARLKFDFE